MSAQLPDQTAAASAAAANDAAASAAAASAAAANDAAASAAAANDAAASAASPADFDVHAAIASNPRWYHTLELAPGAITPGRIDLRACARKLLPAELHGRRALDVGTFDGFWAFELERRGAETVAVDLPAFDRDEWPVARRAELEQRARDWDVELGRGFEIAARALGSGVRREQVSVYELAPERVGGAVDVAFLGALLLHLRDPVRALERIRETLVPGGELIMLEPFSVLDTLRAPRRPLGHFEPLITPFNWWLPNLSALKAWPWAAGFVEVRARRLHHPPAQRPMGGWFAELHARRAH